MDRSFPSGEISLRRLPVALLLLCGFTIPVLSQQELVPGKPVDRSIGPSESQAYSVRLKAGDALRVDLQEKGANVAVKIKSADGKELYENDLGEGFDREKFTFIAEQASTYSLNVDAGVNTKGSYQLVISIGPATENDKDHISAVAASKAGLASFKKQTAEGIMGAIAKFEEAMAAYAKAGDEYSEAELRGNLGVLYSMMGQKPKALEYQEKALVLNRKMGNKIAEAKTLSNIATIYAQTGQMQKSIEHFEQALPILREIGDKSSEVTTTINLAFFYYQLGEFRRAIDLGEKVVSISQSIPDAKVRSNLIATAYTVIGTSHQSLGANEKALDYATRGLALATESGDVRLQANFTNNIALTNAALGDRRKSLAAYQQALEAQRRVGSQEGEAIVLGNIAEAYNYLGDRYKAIEAYNESLAIARKIGVKRMEAQILQSLGNVYGNIGDNARSLELSDQALAVSKAAGGYKDVDTSAYLNKGQTYNELGEYDKGIEVYKAVLDLTRETGSKGYECAAYSSLGQLYEAKKEFDKAREYNLKALEMSRNLGRLDLEHVAVNNLGTVSFNSGDRIKAKEYSADSLILVRSIESKREEPKTTSNLAYFEAYGGNSRLAVLYAKITINLFQKLRSQMQGLDKNTQQTYLRSIEVDYRVLADLLLKQKRFAEAQQVLNLFKDQQYFDFSAEMPLTTVTFTERETKVAADFEQRIEAGAKILRELSALRRTVMSGKATTEQSARIAELDASLKASMNEFRNFVLDLDKNFTGPLDDKDAIPDIKDVAEMQEMLRQTSVETGKNTVAVYTVVGFDDYQALVISPDKVFAVSTPIKKEDLNQKAQTLSSLLRTPKYDPRTASKQLYDIVFAPIAGKLPAKTETILWSLDWNLRYVPMGALYDGRRYMAERFENVVFTRADSGRFTRSVSTLIAGTGLGSSEAHTLDLAGDKFNASALPAVKAEMESIFIGKEEGGVLAGTVLLDSGFDRSAMLSSLKVRRPLVHIASHFRFVPGDEGRSFLLLGDGTPFTLSEMKEQKDIFSGVELLTLSACETASQRPDANGREVDGFAELAQRLGAGAVMASLWEVSDDSTAELMARFYRDYRGTTNSTKAAALRRAQLALLTGRYNKPLSVDSRQLEREGTIPPNVEKAKLKLYRANRSAPFSHPYYWSPFVLIGNWK